MGVAEPGGREPRTGSGPRLLGFHVGYGRIALDGPDKHCRMPGVGRADRGAKLAGTGERSQRLGAFLEQQGHHAARAAGGVGGDVGVVGCQLDCPAQSLLHVGAASRQPVRDSLDRRRRRDGLGRAQRRGQLPRLPGGRERLRNDVGHHVQPGEVDQDARRGVHGAHPDRQLVGPP